MDGEKSWGRRAEQEAAAGDLEKGGSRRCVRRFGGCRFDVLKRRGELSVFDVGRCSGEVGPRVGGVKCWLGLCDYWFCHLSLNTLTYSPREESNCTIELIVWSVRSGTEKSLGFIRPGRADVLVNMRCGHGDNKNKSAPF